MASWFLLSRSVSIRSLFLPTDTDQSSTQGGYNVNAVAESANACVQVIVGDELPFLAPLPPASSSATNTVHEVKLVQRQFWKSMGVPVETAEGAALLPFPRRPQLTFIPSALRQTMRRRARSKPSPVGFVLFPLILQLAHPYFLSQTS